MALPVHAGSDLASNLPLEEDRGSGQAGAKSCHRQGHGDKGGHGKERRQDRAQGCPCCRCSNLCTNGLLLVPACILD